MKSSIKTYSALSVFLLYASLAISQFSVNGKIINSTNEALPSATVVILNTQDSTFVGFGLSDDTGFFELTNIAIGKYSVQVSYLGYEQWDQKIDLTGSLDLGKIVLKSSSNKIQEIVVKGETTPIEIKKDTLEYNANAFTTQENDVVEDLLRKMPGIEVESDGTIVAQGEEVEKVLVDGKEFFGDDPKIATKNLPAKAIDKIKFYDRQSDQSEFTGIDDGERTKTMDLSLKEEYKKGYFGNVGGGLGTDERYELKGSINRFDKKLQASLLGNFNNINEQGFSTTDYFNFMSRAGGGRGRNSGLQINNGLSDGFVTTASGGLNLNYEFNPRSKLNVSYFLNNIDNDIAQSSIREYFLEEDNELFQNESSNQSNANTSHRLQLEWDYEIDSTQDLRVRLTGNLSDGSIINTANTTVTTKLTSATPSNQTTATTLSESDESSIGGNLNYRKKISAKKRIISFSGSINDTDQSDFSDVISESLLFDDPSNPTTDRLEQIADQSNANGNYSLRTSYVEPIGGGKYLEAFYNFRNFSTDLDRIVDDISNDVSINNEALSIAYNRDFWYHRYGLSLQWNTETTSMNFEGALQSSVLDGTIIDENLDIRNDNIAFLPRASIRHELESGARVNLRYSTSVNEPSLEQLQPIVDNSDPLNIYIGNPDLQTEYRHRLRLNFIKFDQFNFRSLFAFINMTYSRNKITNQTSFDDRFRQITTPVNVKDDFSISGRVSYGSPIRKLGIKYRLTTSSSYDNSIVFINAVENDVNRYRANLGWTLENRNKDYFDISIGTNWTYNVNTFSESNQSSQSFLNQSYNSRLAINTFKNWSIESVFDIQVFDEQDFGEALNIPIWTASISHFLLNRRLELKLKIFDILNQNQGLNRSSTLNYVENEEVVSLGRFAMLSALYQLKGMGGSNNKSSNKRMIRF